MGVKVGDVVRIATEWLGPKDDPNRLYIVVEANGRGRASIRAVDCGYMIAPVEAVGENMLRVIGDAKEVMENAI